jgi:hypothetical protein
MKYVVSFASGIVVAVVAYVILGLDAPSLGDPHVRWDR